MCINHVTAEVDFSFESISNGKRSILDHFIILDNMFFLINNYYVTHDVDDFSYHSPIYLNLDIPISYYQSRNTDHAIPRLRWDYASQSDISHYQSTVTNLLHYVQLDQETVYCNHMLCSKHNCCIQSYYDQIVNALIEASRETIPVNQSKSSNRPCIAGWNDHVSITKEKALFWHQLCKSTNCPIS